MPLPETPTFKASPTLHGLSRAAASERKTPHVLSADEHGRWAYLSVFVMKDRVLITTTYSGCEDNPTDAQIIRNPIVENGDPINQKLKIPPLRWFYGGKEPACNPMLDEAYEPARP